METSPITNASMGIKNDGSKFRDIRAKAQEDSIARHKSKKKDKSVPVPLYKIDDEVVITNGGIWSKSKHYTLVKVVDFDIEMDSFKYFGIVLKTTNPALINRIGRLREFSERQTWMAREHAAKVTEQDIKWL